MAADFENDLLTGLATLLQTASAGTWNPTGVYTSGQTAIILGELPQSPDRVITLLPYGVDDDPSLSDSVIGVQISTRWGGGDPRETERSTGRVFDALHGLHAVQLSTGVRVVQILRRSKTSIGQDANGRWRTVQNFYCTVHRPSPHRQ